MRKKQTIRYDADRDVWCAILGERSYPLHCGEGFALYMAGKAYPCRLELDTDWYVLIEDTRFILHRRTVYAVGIDG